jgi:branched-chain amino acid transport system substrate-binding protein
MPMSRRRLLTGGAAAALCQTAGYGLTSLPARAQEAAQGDKLPLIRIGVLTDLSGQYRDNSGPTSVAAAHQAVEDFNPKAHGFDVAIVSADHQQKPDTASAVAREWFERGDVDTIADMNNTAIAVAVTGVANTKDKALLVSGAASSDLTGRYCSENIVHFTPDSWADSHACGDAIIDRGGDSWFLVVANYRFGHTMAEEITALATKRGGKVLGSVDYAFPGTTDYSSYLIQAQASGAKVLGLCNTGGDMEACVKQAREFGLTASGMQIAALMGFITEVHSMGIETAQGLLLAEPFYWDLNERTRAFTKRFLPKSPNNYPSSLHATCYAAVTHYLKAVAHMGPAAAKASGRAAIAAMKSLPTDDDCFGAGSIRADGRFLCPMTLFQVKTPGESKAPWDLYKPVSTIAANKAFRPLEDGHCAFIHA